MQTAEVTDLIPQLLSELQEIKQQVKTPINKQIWDDKQVAEYLGIGYSTFLREMKSPSFTPTPFKVGKSRRWWASEIISWAENSWKNAKRSKTF